MLFAYNKKMSRTDRKVQKVKSIDYSTHRPLKNNVHPILYVVFCRFSLSCLLGKSSVIVWSVNMVKSIWTM